MLILKIFFLFITFYPFSAQSEIQIFDRFGSNLPVIIGSSCKDVENQFTQLQNSLKLLDIESNISILAQNCNCRNKSCLNPILGQDFLVNDTILPLQKKLNFVGPNCWNTTLIAAKAIKNLRYVSDKEFSSLINRSNCQTVSEKSAKPGDIIAIREVKNNTIDEIHAFIYLNPNLGAVLSKNGKSFDEVINIDNYDYVNDYYNVSEPCRGLLNLPPTNSSKCDKNRYSNILRCEFKPDKYSVDISKKINEKLIEIETKVNTLSTDSQKYNKTEILKILSVLNDIGSDMEEVGKLNGFEKKSIEDRFYSLLRQLGEFTLTIN